jgi:lambda repressor-like predicted transcriptional regulator
VHARHVTTAVTLLVLLAILVAGALVGVRSLFAPISDGPNANPSPDCVSKPLRKGQRVLASQVEVSVFNAGSRSGLARATLAALVRRGFKKGESGNAPEGSGVKVAQVWTTERNDAAARLVARQFGPAIKVFTGRQDLGPGIDVVVGNGYHKLAKAQRAVVATKRSSACLPSATASPR